VPPPTAGSVPCVRLGAEQERTAAPALRGRDARAGAERALKVHRASRKVDVSPAELEKFPHAQPGRSGCSDNGRDGRVLGRACDLLARVSRPRGYTCRRRSGSVTSTRVPSPGRDITCSVPRSSSTRSRMPRPRRSGALHRVNERGRRSLLELDQVWSSAQCTSSHRETGATCIARRRPALMATPHGSVGSPEARLARTFEVAHTHCARRCSHQQARTSGRGPDRS
jgi:hypothetical protein